jgi:hypothetical protein
MQPPLVPTTRRLGRAEARPASSWPSDRHQPSTPAGIDLYWLPLGAGGHSVRLNGKVFEAVAAWCDRRERCDLYHAALQIRLPEGRFVIEQAPAWGDGAERGVVAGGAVGLRVLGHLRLFRYEVRCWRDGVIPDIAEAVASPIRLTTDPARARRLLALVPQVPTPVWGRDELRAGEMWNSNATVSWLIARSGLDVCSVPLPPCGRAPGWQAGIVVARRQQGEAAHAELTAGGSTTRGDLGAPTSGKNSRGRVRPVPRRQPQADYSVVATGRRRRR